MPGRNNPTLDRLGGLNGPWTSTNYISRKEIIKVAKTWGLDVGCTPRTAHDAPTPALVPTPHLTDVEQVDFEECCTGSYIFENGWPELPHPQKLRTGTHLGDPADLHPPPRYPTAVKVIDIFGNDTMVLVPLNVG